MLWMGRRDDALYRELGLETDWEPRDLPARRRTAPAVPRRVGTSNTPLRTLIYDLGGCSAVAARLGVAPSTVSRWTAHKVIGGTTPPLTRLRQLAKLAELAGVDANWPTILRLDR